MKKLGFFFIAVYTFFFYSVYQLNKEKLYDFELTEGIVIYIACYIIPVLFFFKFDFPNFKYIKIPNDGFILKLFSFLCIGGIISIFYYFGSAIAGLSGDLGDNRNEIYEGSSSIGVGLIPLIFSFFSSCYPIHIICFFYGCILKESFYSKYKWFFLLASFSYIFRVLAFVGRDGPVFWSLIFFPLFILFKSYINKKDLKIITIFITIFISSSIFLVAAITISRFGESTKNPLINMYYYFAQSLYNFNSLYESYDDFQFGKLNFQMFRFLGADSLSTEDFFKSTEKFNLIGWVFYGSLGGFFMDFGFLSFIFYLIVLPFFILKNSKKKVLTFKMILFLIFIFFLLLHGLFYFNLKSLEGNFFLLLLFVLARLKFTNYYIIKNSEYD